MTRVPKSHVVSSDLRSTYDIGVRTLDVSLTRPKPITIQLLPMTPVILRRRRSGVGTTRLKLTTVRAVVSQGLETRSKVLNNGFT